MKSSLSYIPKPRPIWLYEWDARVAIAQIRFARFRATCALNLIRLANMVCPLPSPPPTERPITVDELISITHIERNARIQVTVGEHLITVEHHPAFLRAALHPQNPLHN